MDYETLYQTYQKLEKELKDKLTAIQKLQKSISKNMEIGDLKAFQKDIAALEEAASEQKRIFTEMKETVDTFDMRAYLEQGDFAGQMLEICKEQQVDVNGDFPSYEMFPYRVKFDTENQDIQIDRKKMHCMRPQYFVKKIKAGQEKLLKASFNASAFANELAEAYDLAILKQKKEAGKDFLLANLYKFLAPMGRFRKEYDQQSYAFDLARLYSSGIEETKEGRIFQFGPVRKNEKAIRILDKNGKEQFLSTIRFFNKEG